MTIDKKKLGIQILSLVGIIITIKLACIYYVANFQQYALSSFCSTNQNTPDKLFTVPVIIL